MFKNIIAYSIGPGWNPTLAAIEAALAPMRFIECAPTQEKSIGWIEPRGEKHGCLVESVGGQWILKVQTETKNLPGSVIAAKTAKQVEAIEQATGRKPGKKEKREIREDARLTLLPMAFTRVSSSLVWIDRTANLLVIEAGSQAHADAVISLLVKSLDGFTVTNLQTTQSPGACMATWLNTQELPSGFTADRDCVLKACDESKATIRYARHPLDIDEIRAHVLAGKTPTQLAMTWDGKVSFVLSETGAIKKLTFLDCVFTDRAAAEKAKDCFDADVAISTGLLAKMLPDLVDAMGGEIELAA